MSRLTTYAGVMLVVCGGLVTAQTPQTDGRVAPAPPAAPPTSRTFKVTIEQDRNDLQKAIELLSDEIGVPIEIVKDDMREYGITRCQSFGLQERNQSVEHVLRSMLLRAEPDGKLVYTVKPSPEGVRTVYIAVRREAEKRGETLFPEFAIKQPERYTFSPPVDARWSAYIRPVAIESEVRRQIAAFDEAYRSQTPEKTSRAAIVQLAVLFSIIEQHDGEVCWKSEAGSIRTVLVNNKPPLQTWDIKQLRHMAALRTDLMNLLSGNKWPHDVKPNLQTTWREVAARSDLMRRIESGHRDRLAKWDGTQESLIADRAALLCEAEVIAALARVIQDPSYEFADDREYARYAKAFEQQAQTVAQAVVKGDSTGLKLEIGRLQKNCNDCHAGFR